MAKKIDITGQKFNSLTAIEIVGKNKHGSYLWLCKCDCGNLHTATYSYLRRGEVKSCGCLIHKKSKEVHTKHGMTRTRTT